MDDEPHHGVGRTKRKVAHWRAPRETGGMDRLGLAQPTQGLKVWSVHSMALFSPTAQLSLSMTVNTRARWRRPVSTEITATSRAFFGGVAQA